MKTRTRLNLRFLTCLLVVGAALGVGVHLVHGYQVKRNASAFLDMADKAKGEADTAKQDAETARESKDSAKEKEFLAKEKEHRKKEIEYLARFLGLVPRDIDAMARYGEALDENAKQSDSPRARMDAYLRLENVLRLDESRAELHRRQVYTAMYFRKFDDALRHLVKLEKLELEKLGVSAWKDVVKLEKLGDSARKDAAELLRLRADCEVANGHLDKALDAYETAKEIAPKQIDNYWNLAVLYRERFKDVTKADAIVAEMLDNGEPPFRAFLTKARYYLQFDSKHEDRLKLAKEAVEHASEFAPDEPDVALMAAEVDRTREKPNDAREVLRSAIEKHPREAKLYFALLMLEVRDNKTKEALAVARKGLQALRDVHDENKTELLHALADLLVQTGELEEAEKAIARLNKLPRFPKPLLNYLQGRVSYHKGKWGEASKLLEDVRSQLAPQSGLEVQTLLLLGQCHEQLGNPDQALLDYQKAQKLDPLNVTIRSRTAALLMSMNRTDEAVAEFRNLLTAPKVSAGMHVTLARALIAHNARLPRRERKLDEIHRELDLAAKLTPEPADLPILQAMAIVLGDDKKTGDALKVIELAREKRPEDLNLWLASAQLSNPEKALSILEKARAYPKLANRVELQLARLRYLLLAIPPDNKLEERKKATETLRTQLTEMEKQARDLSTEADRSRLINGVAEVRLLLGDTAEAERLLKLVAQQQPNNLSVRLMLFDVALLTKSTESMARLLEELRAIEGDSGVYWRYAKASLLIQEAQPDSKEELSDKGRQQLRLARQYLDEAAKLRSRWPRIFTLQAEIDEREGKTSAAIAKYQYALELGERRPLIVRKTVQLLLDQNRVDEINQAVRKLLGNQDDTLLAAGLGKLAAVNLLADPESPNFDQERAVKFARSSVSEDSKSYQDLLFLGRVQWVSSKGADGKKVTEREKLSKQAEAEKLFRRACDLAPNVPDTWVTLVSFLADIGKKEQAEQVIKQAAEKLPADQRPFALASCYDKTGHINQAKENYLAALKAAPDDVRLLRQVAIFYMSHGQAGEAETHLRTILKLKDNQADEDAMWARRSLAAVLSSNPSPAKFNEAFALIEANLAKDPNSLADKHAKAVLLATRRSKYKEAINLFEKLKPLPAKEQFTLARLYMFDNEWDKARLQMMVLLQTPEGNNPTYAAYYARSLIEHNDIGPAEAQLAKLKKALPPDSPLTREIEARVLRAKNQDEEAIRVVLEYAKDVTDLAPVGVFLESLGQNSKSRELYLKEAEKMFRKHVEQSKKPDRFLPLAAFLGRRQQIDDALSYCQQAERNQADAEAVAQTIAKVLRDGSAGEQHCRRAEQWMKNMLAQAPQSAPLMIFLADVYDYQGRFEDAERMYRSALEKDPDNVIILNNLAWLLAFKDQPAREEALAMIKKSIDLVGEGPELLDTRGILYLQMGHPDLALKDLQEVVARAPSPNRFFHLALALASMADNKEKAKQVLAEARKRGFDIKRLHPLERKIGAQLIANLQNVN